jgi:carbon-monoxide dehydrogenase small subunit
MYHAAACHADDIPMAPSAGTLYPMQKGFREHYALNAASVQGMAMAAVDLVNRSGHDLDEHPCARSSEGKICRCTGYHNMVKAILSGANAMA